MGHPHIPRVFSRPASQETLMSNACQTSRVSNAPNERCELSPDIDESKLGSFRQMPPRDSRGTARTRRSETKISWKTAIQGEFLRALSRSRQATRSRIAEHRIPCRECVVQSWRQPQPQRDDAHPWDAIRRTMGWGSLTSDADRTGLVEDTYVIPIHDWFLSEGGKTSM